MTSEEVLQRHSSLYDPLSRLAEPLLVPLSSRRYNQQFATLYDYRLRRLKHPKGRLVRKATEQWWEGKGTLSQMMKSSQGSSSDIQAKYVKRMLDVKQGEICFVIGTIYCSMHLKPDVLEELSREVSARTSQ
jgi:DNA polymerase delta subunit 2